MKLNARLIFSEKFIQIVSLVNAGISFRDLTIEPLILDINESNQKIGSSVRLALAKCTYIDDGQERLKRIQESELQSDIYQNIVNEELENLAKVYQYKSVKSLERDLMSVSITLIDKFYLYPNITTREGYTGLRNVDTIVLSNEISDEELGANVKIAMTLCKSIYKKYT